MDYYLIACRSLTYAQRTAAMLERGGVTARIRRTPAGLARAGCGYSVRISRRCLDPARILLKEAECPVLGLYHAEEDGTWQEVPL